MFEAKIDRKLDTYTISANGQIYCLKLGKGPLAIIPPNTIDLSVRIPSSQEDGYFFIEGTRIISGIYQVQSGYWVLQTGNDTHHYQFIYRETTRFTPVNDFVKYTNEYEKIYFAKSKFPAENLVSQISDNRKTSSQRPAALRRFYVSENDIESCFAVIDNIAESRGSQLLKHFEGQLKNIAQNIDYNTANKVGSLLHEFHQVFVLPGDPLPTVDDVEHKIHLDIDTPIFTPLYKHPIFMQPIIEEQINKFKKQRLIRDSHSPYQSNVWIVPKKSDNSHEKKWRMVLDFRNLNSHTQQDCYPLPSIEEILCLLGGANYMSAFDMSNGFHAVKVHKDSIAKTAFSTHKEHLEWVRMPQDLINAPATYQRMMNYKRRGLIGKI